MGKTKRGNKSKSHSHKSISHLHKKYKTKRKTKDHDQIHEDLKKENFKNLLIQPVDYDLTGNAQSYCIHCARYFLDDSALKAHFRTKLHKRRIKALQIEPYTQDEANRAAGIGSYIQPKLLLDIKTQPEKSEFLAETQMEATSTINDNILVET